MIGQSLRRSAGGFLAGVAVVLGSQLTAGATRADPIVQTTTIARQPSDWNSSFTFDKFDPALGTLGGVALKVDADLLSTVTVESREAAPSNFSASVIGNVNVTRPGNGALMVGTSPYAYTSATLGAFDGSVDYAGTSGQTSAISGSSTATSGGILTPSDQALFTGPGTVSLPVTAQARATLYGPANMVGGVTSSLGATGTLTYNVGAADPSTPGGGGIITTRFIPPFIPWGAETAKQVVAIDSQTTGWSTSAAFQQFDAALGSLIAVKAKLTSNVTADRSLENLGTSSTFMNFDQEVTLTIKLLDDDTLLSLATLLSGSVGLAAFDGVADFAGLSGITLADVAGSKSDIGFVTDLADLQTFIGTGSITLPVLSRSTSHLEGPGNMAFDLAAEAGGTIELSYFYDPVPGGDVAAVPEPAPLAVLMLPLLGIAVARRRRPNAVAGSPLEGAAAA